MSTSLALQNGDLAINGRTYATVSGKDKLFQDLRCELLEPLGSDPATPGFGTSLNGIISGTTEIPGVIGGYTTASLILDLKAEFADLLERHQTLQLQTIQDDMVAYNNQTTLDPDEVIQSIDSIDAITSGDTIIVRITLTTIGDRSFSLTMPLQRTQ
jgi:hypothetical protein